MAANTQVGCTAVETDIIWSSRVHEPPAFTIQFATSTNMKLFATAFAALAAVASITNASVTDDSVTDAYLVGLFESADVQVDMKVNPATEAYLVGLFEASQVLSAKYICGAIGKDVSKVQFVFAEGTTKIEAGATGKVEYFVESAGTKATACSISIAGHAPVRRQLEDVQHIWPWPFLESANVTGISITGSPAAPKTVSADLSARGANLGITITPPSTAGAQDATFKVEMFVLD
ncbi:hypothetical protein SDRG_04524 [Saprolegnia diclina VS20]|uniref:Uncharacterized protein n=1 Tax=Saprolegnia diclina (strain VS20) TaxID=1156394 RepID=T0QJA4_SAPDV|nr:hypothetical protein SDRG_04524 [Saprolegnia diclina VS20]EQC38094.1 hypothetical protein SDRG_04524 [Saprolegnia diclina VS20]|eukprot:XP_008608421.1 hypothetical protein SDRG_04524 [Saprolegnia diclina VS20]